MKRLSGIVLPRPRHTGEEPVRALPLPGLVRIPMQMHTGDPCTPAFSPGDPVFCGTRIGNAENPGAVPIHSSVSGTVRAIHNCPTASGDALCIDIETDGEQRIDPACKPPLLEKKDDLICAALDSGCVEPASGVPVSEKLSAAKKFSVLVVCGACCEPYLTAEHRLLNESPEEVIGGVSLIMRLMKIKEARIATSAGNPIGTVLLSELAQKEKGITVCPLPARYPQESEQIAVYHTTGKIVPTGTSPADMGILVLNIRTCAFLYRYSTTGIPMIETVVSVGGDAVSKAFDLRVPVGVSMRKLLDYAGCNYENLDTLFTGGAMSGTPLSSTDLPVCRQLGSLTAMRARKPVKEGACIRCGKCMNACPAGLMPFELDAAYRQQDTALLRAFHAELCMECGCCTYVCPAKHPITERIRLGKALI